MSTRTVDVALRMIVAGYTAGAAQASIVTKKLQADIETASKSGKKNLDTVGVAMLGVSAAGAAGFGLMAVSAMNFESQLSEVGAVTGATGEQLEKLRQQALDAGQATVFSAQEAAQAQTELAKAGVSTADIMGGALDGALNLASAGQLDLAQAATIAAQTMTTFGLSGKDVASIADALAAGANKSAANVDDLAMGLQQSGLVADQFGLTMEQTVGTLSLFSANALNGSDAGTSFKTMLMALNGTSAESKKAMEELGLDFYDATGAFVGIESVAEQLKTQLSGLTEEQRNSALATIFGTDAVRAANILYKSGAAGVADWTKQVSEAGYAAELAAQKNDNLKGDIEQLGGALQTNLIEGGSLATGALRGLAQAATTTLNGFAGMPTVLQGVGVGFAGIVTAGTGVLGTIALVAPRVEDLKKSLTSMGSLGTKVASNLGTIAAGVGALGLALAAGAFVLGLYQEEQRAAEDRIKRATQALQDQTGTLDENANSWIAAELASSGLGDQLVGTGADIAAIGKGIKESGTELDRWGDALSGNMDYLHFKDEVKPAILEAAAAGDVLAQQLKVLMESGKSDEEMMTIIRGFDGLNDALDQANDKTAVADELTTALTGSKEQGAEATQQQAQAEQELSDAMQKAVEAADDQLSGAHDLFDAQRDMADSARSVEEAQGRVNDASRERADLARDQEDAERGLIDAQEALADLQRELADIPDDRAKANLDVRSAELDVIDAEKELAKAKPEDRERAEINLARARLRVGDATEAVAEIDRRAAGAGRELADARDKIADAQDKVTEAHERGAELARDQADAVDELQSAMLDAATAASALAIAQGIANGESDTAWQKAQHQKAAYQELIDQLAPGNPLRQHLQGLVDALNAIPKNPEIVMEISAKFGANAEAIQLLMNQGKTKEQIEADIAIWQGIQKADGGILTRFASGGMAGAGRVAQIAPAGANILWGEPETGGEAYIPFAPSKRARALDIYAETGRRLGVHDARTMAMSGAGGGGYASPSTSTAGSGRGGVTIEHLEVTTVANASANEVVDAINAKLGWKLTARGDR